jgi:hypothetical protein
MKKRLLSIITICITVGVIGLLIWFADVENDRTENNIYEISYLNGKKDTMQLIVFVHYPPYLSQGCFHNGSSKSAVKCYVTGFRQIK